MTRTTARRIVLICGAALFVLFFVGLGTESRAVVASSAATHLDSAIKSSAPALGPNEIGASVPLTTPTRPPFTFTPTRTATPSPTPGVCPPGGRYMIAEVTGTIVPGVTDTGNHCDDCATFLALPFPVRIYDGVFTGVMVESNGWLRFGGSPFTWKPGCQPIAGITYGVFPFLDDLRTDTLG